eukprot:3671872-Pyramimonas_sp.AAC.2
MATDMTHVTEAWNASRRWAAQSPQQRVFIAMGGFNTSAVPSFNFKDPSARWRPMAPDGRCQREQARWRQLFASLTEITHDLPTHFSANTQAATAIDRICIALSDIDLMNVDAHLKIHNDGATLSDQGLSDHAILHLVLANATAARPEEQAIDPNVFHDPSYQ